MTLTPLLSAILGALGGLISGFLSERFKTRVARIERELDRLDAIYDDVEEVLSFVAGTDNGPLLRRIARERTRLGKNLRREMSRYAGFSDIERDIGMLAATLAKVPETAVAAQANAELLVLLDDRFAAVRRSVRAPITGQWWWRLLRAR